MAAGEAATVVPLSVAVAVAVCSRRSGSACAAASATFRCQACSVPDVPVPGVPVPPPPGDTSDADGPPPRTPRVGKRGPRVTAVASGAAVGMPARLDGGAEAPPGNMLSVTVAVRSPGVGVSADVQVGGGHVRDRRDQPEDGGDSDGKQRHTRPAACAVTAPRPSASAWGPGCRPLLATTQARRGHRGHRAGPRRRGRGGAARVAPGTDPPWPCVPTQVCHCPRRCRVVTAPEAPGACWGKQRQWR